jgi:glucose/arabinose dehydrogenase
MAKRRFFELAMVAAATITIGCGDDDGNGDDGGAGADAGSGGGADAGAAPDGGGVVSCPGDDPGLDLPDGFCATIMATSLGRARHMAVTPSGDLFVAVAPTVNGSDPGEIVALRDADGDGEAETQERFGEPGGNGIAWRDGQLYVAGNESVLRYPLPDGELVPTGPPTAIVSGLVTGADHPVKSVAFAGDDILVNIGSATNSCQAQNRMVESPGLDPCPELDVRAAIFRFADTEGQSQADGEPFVVGARNVTALTTHPITGAIIGVINGRDELAQDWPDLYTEEDDDRLPSEEYGVLAEGQDWGWPYCYHDPIQDRKVLAPEYGGDGTMVGRCEAAEPPLAALPAHWAPLGIAIYDGDALPERYRGGAFIAFHGSRYEPEPEGDIPGYNVMFLPLDANGTPAGEAEMFAGGFAGPGRPLPDQAEHRPVSVTQAPDGSLYVSSDKSGHVWRIFYAGQQD